MSATTHAFKTEVQQLLDLVIHSLYSKKEIFLRELISNASDAIDRAKFEALTTPDLLENDTEGRIRISVDREARTLTVSDNGIGMSAQEIEQNIGTIANSGTRLFLENLKKAGKAADVEFIGQFGVGFYSSFMVADKVTVITRRAGAGHTAYKWVSDGSSTYTVEPAEKDSRGTDVILHLREGEGMDDLLTDWRIRQLVRQYSDYIACPIVMAVSSTKDGKTETHDETLNSMRAIWRKARSEVTAEEYRQFYRHVSHDHLEPLETIHMAAEGAMEFRALLFIPSQAPYDLFMNPQRRGLHLYVKNVLIMDDCKDLLPDYLRFVPGVVDSSDLPLNVSREMLQDDAIIRRIRKSLVNKVLGTLDEVRKKRFDDYVKFFAQFGRILKEGVAADSENSAKLQELFLFSSSKTEAGKPVSLREYCDRMPSDQKDIYYLTADSLDAARNSPHLEAINARGFEVLFLVDPIDEWVAQNLTEYDGKPLKAINRGSLDLSAPAGEKKDEAKPDAAAEGFEGLLTFIREQLGSEVSEVRLSSRLTDSPCCLVAAEDSMPPGMERILRAMNQEVPKAKRILEINPKHAVTQTLKKLFETSPDSADLKDFAGLLYGQALVLEGEALPDPKEFARRLSKLMVSAAG